MIHDSFLRQPQELNMHTLFGVIASGKLGITEFESMYESFNPLTTVNKQHFVEWFSGSALDSIWTTAASSGTFTMDDNVDGGMIAQTTSTATNTNIQINWNNKRPFDETASVCIFTILPEIHEDTSTNWFIKAGMGYTLGNTGHWLDVDSSATYFRLGTSQSESHSYVNSSIVLGNTLLGVKIENKASSCEMTLTGVLEATATTGLQTSTGMQPLFYGNRGTNTPAGSPLTYNLRYFEAYNT